MSNKTRLYIDVDDTLISRFMEHSKFELRPGIITQISALTKLFDCYWLTHWDSESLRTLWQLLYSPALEKDVKYAYWRTTGGSKAAYVLAKTHEFYWLEDPLSTGDLSELKDSNLIDRYIPIQPVGLWGFTRGVRVLFEKAGITEENLEEIGASPEWFKEPLGDYFDWKFY